jgi:hypothetical protein
MVEPPVVLVFEAHFIAEEDDSDLDHDAFLATRCRMASFVSGGEDQTGNSLTLFVWIRI